MLSDIIYVSWRSETRKLFAYIIILSFTNIVLGFGILKILWYINHTAEIACNRNNTTYIVIFDIQLKKKYIYITTIFDP